MNFSNNIFFGIRGKNNTLQLICKNIHTFFDNFEISTLFTLGKAFPDKNENMYTKLVMESQNMYLYVEQ